MYYVGDRIWTVACAFIGAYLTAKSFLQLCVIPIFPDAVSAIAHLEIRPRLSHRRAIVQGLERFVMFEWPELTKMSDAGYQAILNRHFLGDPAVFIPFLFVCILGGIGIYLQVWWSEASSIHPLPLRSCLPRQ